MRSFTRLIATRSLPAIIICLLAPEAADAYLDPGTGSIILQVAIAGLVGGLVALKIFWNRIRTFFKSLFSRGARDEAAGN